MPKPKITATYLVAIMWNAKKSLSLWKAGTASNNATQYAAIQVTKHIKYTL